MHTPEWKRTPSASKIASSDCAHFQNAIDTVRCESSKGKFYVEKHPFSGQLSFVVCFVLWGMGVGVGVGSCAGFFKTTFSPPPRRFQSPPSERSFQTKTSRGVSSPKKKYEKDLRKLGQLSYSLYGIARNGPVSPPKRFQCRGMHCVCVGSCRIVFMYVCPKNQALSPKADFSDAASLLLPLSLLAQPAPVDKSLLAR